MKPQSQNEHEAIASKPTTNKFFKNQPFAYVPRGQVIIPDLNYSMIFDYYVIVLYIKKKNYKTAETILY